MSSKVAHTSKKVKTSVKNAAYVAAKALRAEAPKAVLSIPSDVRYGSLLRDSPSDSLPGAAIRSVGATKRIFVLKSHFTSAEMHGLAYRIDKLSRNTSINSILLSSNAEGDDASDMDIVLPTSALETEKIYDRWGDEGTSPGYGRVWHVSSGYDVHSIASMQSHERREILDNLRKLALAIKGAKGSKIPFISVPHGLLTDGGYALAMGSYALATHDTRFQIMNPQRGLSLDPIGLSYILPRLGWEYEQPSAKYPVGNVLALTGYEASAEDMVETGLATHYIDSYLKLGMLERSFGSITPYDEQKLKKDPVKQYGREDQMRVDVNLKYRNRMVANIIHGSSVFDASGQEFLTNDEDFSENDPSLVLTKDENDVFSERESLLLDIACTFKDIFRKEKSVVGIMERLKELAHKEASNDEEKEFVDCANELLTRMEKQSPLALKTVHKLLQIGQQASQTLDRCMQREQRVQLKLFDGEDYQKWAASGLPEGEFTAWKHANVSEVTNDEVEELIGEA